MDYQLEQWINGPAGQHHVLDTIAVLVANWAEPLFISIVVLWFVVGWAHGRVLDRQGALGALLAAGAALLINVIISHVWDRARPFVAHPGTVHVLLAHSQDASFPSDHAAAAFAIAAVLLAAYRPLGVTACAFAVLVSYARVYVGDHYPGDVLAGAVIGLIVGALLVTWLYPVVSFVRQLADSSIRLAHLPLRDTAPSYETSDAPAAH